MPRQEHQPAGPRALAVGVLAALALLAASCDEPGAAPPVAPAPAYPPGTALAIGGHPIAAEDIERYVPMIEIIEPEFVRRDHLRKVLSNIVLPTAAGAALLPEDREAAYQRASELLAAARETGTLPDGAPEANPLSGPWVKVGMVSWFEAMSMEPGTYSPLHETPGAWTFFELISTGAPPGEFHATTEVSVRRYDVRYLPDEALHDLVQEALDTLPIDIVDPEWEPLVPPLFLYRSGSLDKGRPRQD